MDGYDEPPRQRSPWVIPVIVGVVVGVIVVGAVIVGVKLSRGQWNSVEAESDSGSTTSRWLPHHGAGEMDRFDEELGVMGA